MTLADLIRQDRFASPAQKALLNVLATASYVQGEMADALLLASAKVKPAALEASGFEFEYTGLEDALRHLLGK